MKLSIIILNYNVRFFLEQSILSVERALHGIDAEIIVADNDSKDDSCDMVRQRFPHVTLLENKENLGFSKANNRAVEVAKGEYVCILNPDTAIAEDTFLKALKYVEKQSKFGALGVYLMDGTGNYLPESKRNIPTPWRSLLKLVGWTKGTNGYYAHHVNDRGMGEVDTLVGAFMLMKRSVYNEVGGFDEDYFMYGEDIDLSYKLIKAGYKNHYLGDLCVLHYKGESTQKDNAYLDRFYGAMRIFYKKHFRSNFIQHTFMNFGVMVAKTFRRRKESKKKVIAPYTEKVLVFTESIALLKKLSEIYDIPVRSGSKTAMGNALFTNTLCIFDVDYVSYQQIFSVMQQRKNKQNSFRIKPPGCNFVIGSDQSDQKGSVRKL
ncbi:MAG: glycosyltransferase family 2 protein [Flavobacteriaceae bacterium]|nr:glycosyltransferase family 2 protein [Flavobacteriaceae bacterium]